MAREFEPAVFDGADVRIQLDHPGALVADHWREIQDLSRVAFGSAFPHRSDLELNHFVPKQSPELYGQRVINPTLAIPEGNSFANPLVARAFYTRGSNVVQESNSFVAAHRNDDRPRGVLIGYAALADNTSGKFKAMRDAKMLIDDTRYAWISRLVVHPRFQGAGVGTAVVRAALESGHYKDRQPVSAYTLEDNAGGTRADTSMGRSFVQEVLGLSRRKDHDSGKPLAPIPRHIFGDDERAVMQTAWNVRTVGAVKDALRRRQNDLRERNGHAVGRPY